MLVPGCHANSLFHADPGQSKQTEELRRKGIGGRTAGPTAGQERGGGMDRGRSFRKKKGGKSDGRNEIYRKDIMCVCIEGRH